MTCHLPVVSHLKLSRSLIDHDSLTTGSGMVCALGIPENWLAAENLKGKSVKVRIRGSESIGRNASHTWENGVHEGKIACTLGMPVSGNPPVIRVKLMSSVARELSVPLRYLVPIHPDGAKENAVVIVGDSDNIGLEGRIVDAIGIYWTLQVRTPSQAQAGSGPGPCDAAGGPPSQKQKNILVPREQLAVCMKFRAKPPF
jgi:hypothetical protein